MDVQVFKCNKCCLEKSLTERRKKENKCKECHNKESRERYKNKQETFLKEIEEGVLKVLKCSKCKEEKDVSNFCKNFRNCKECSSIELKKSNIINKDKREEKKEIIRKQEFIFCNGCNTEKKREEFAINYISYCKSCSSKHNKIKYEKNSEKIIQYERDKRKAKDIIKNSNIIEKECSSCNIIKNITEYSLSSNGYNSHCKECRKNEMVKYREEMKEEINRKRRENYKVKTRTVNTIITKLRKNVLRLLKVDYSKTEKAKELLGITPLLFQEWLKYNCNIDNIDYNSKKNTWHIDHIIPCKLFKISSEKDSNIIPCFHWTNMIPLDAKKNIKKQFKIVLEQINIVKERLKNFIKEHKLNYDEHMMHWNTTYNNMINKVHSFNKIQTLNTGSQ